MPRHRLIEPTRPLVAPALIASFDGWVDAAAAASAAAATLAEGGTPVVTFDPDDLYDFRSRRPVLDIVDGRMTELRWPDLRIRHVERGGRDLLVLTGPEPDFRWQELGADLSVLCVRLGVVEWMSLGAIPSAVPHTHEVPILSTASRSGLLRGDEGPGPQGLMRVPSAALSAIEYIANANGIPSVGFYAQIPHYVGGPYPAATVALLQAAGRHLGVDVPLGDLQSEAAATRRRLDAAVAADEDSADYVQRLETQIDEEHIPSGDELASEIERFLQGQSGPQSDEGPGERP